MIVFKQDLLPSVFFWIKKSESYSSVTNGNVGYIFVAYYSPKVYFIWAIYIMRKGPRLCLQSVIHEHACITIQWG